jgi:hypothetical protein
VAGSPDCQPFARGSNPMTTVTFVVPPLGNPSKNHPTERTGHPGALLRWLVWPLVLRVPHLGNTWLRRDVSSNGKGQEPWAVAA